MKRFFRCSSLAWSEQINLINFQKSSEILTLLQLTTLVTGNASLKSIVVAISRAVMNQDPEDAQDQGPQQRNEEEHLVAAGNEPRVSHSDADGWFKTYFLLMFNAYMLNHFDSRITQLIFWVYWLLLNKSRLVEVTPITYPHNFCLTSLQIMTHLRCSDTRGHFAATWPWNMQQF